MTCNWCKSNSGRIKKYRECCELRELAQAPKSVRAAVRAKMSDADWLILRERLIQENFRLKEIKR